MNECSKTLYRVENLDDQTEIFFLDDKYRVTRVHIALVPHSPGFTESRYAWHHLASDRTRNNRPCSAEQISAGLAALAGLLWLAQRFGGQV
jgi:hypothetical protein